MVVETMEKIDNQKDGRAYYEKLLEFIIYLVNYSNSRNALKDQDFSTTCSEIAKCVNSRFSHTNKYWSFHISQVVLNHMPDTNGCLRPTFQHCDFEKLLGHRYEE